VGTQFFFINDVNGECVRVFLLVEVQSYYKLRDLEEQLNTDFVVNFYEFHDSGWVMDSWWREDKKYTNQTSEWYQMAKLWESYIYLMALICQLYGEKECSRFSKAWLPLSYIVVVSGRHFNWGAIISNKSSICIQQAHTPKKGETPSFWMDLYLLDIMCARNVFVGMKLSWHASELLVHVYFNILWENRYKKSYSLIYDEFIACIYFILFKKECLRLSAMEKKVIEKVSHWYLNERDT
jgi:hypothetical protein